VSKAITFSIALCTYNGEQFLQSQLDSFLQQTRWPDELVVCDDASQDRTVQVLQDFAAHSPFPVRLFLNEKNLGYAKNFAQAVSLCQGDIIALSDQDDVWLPAKLARLGNLFRERREIGLGLSDAAIVDETLTPLGYSYFEVMRLTAGFQQRFCREPGVAFSYLLNHSMLGAIMAFRAHWREHILPIPDFWPHDHWIAFMLSILTKPAAINIPLIKYRQHRDQCYGIVKGDYFKRFKKILRKDRHYYDQLAVKWSLARNIIASKKNVSPDHYLKALDDKINHLKAKAEMPKCRWKRIAALAREVYSGRYFKYSDSWKHIIKDMLATR
jgi:glycosyltransferase involved in cell wall biosynthesis